MKFVRLTLALTLLIAGCATQQPAKVTTLPPAPPVITAPANPLASIMPPGLVPPVLPEQPTPATMIMRSFAQAAVVTQPGPPGFVFLPCTLFVSWNSSVPNPDTGETNIPTHYDIYYGDCPRHYTQQIQLGNVTNAAVSNLTATATYYFAVTALDDEGHESDYSAELQWTVHPQFAELHLDPPGDALLASPDLFTWSSRDGTLTNGVWRIKVSNASTEFYRSLILPAQTNLP